MKKVCAFLMSMLLCCGVLIRYPLCRAAAAADLEAALAWAVAIANDDSHGYSQTARNGPDYDCSSFIFYALKNAGFAVGNTAFNTRDMRSALTGIGFIWIPWSELGNVSKLQRGDILLTEGAHTEFYLGDKKCAAAADQQQGILVENYWGNNFWEGVLRLPAPAQPVIPAPDQPVVKVTAGDAAHPVSVCYQACANATDYCIRFYDAAGKLFYAAGNCNEAKVFSNCFVLTDTNYSHTFPAGNYSVTVTAVNANSGLQTVSAAAAFTVAAVPEPRKQLTVRYHVNGGTIADSTEYLADATGLITLKATGAPFAAVWHSGQTFSFADAAAFGLSKSGCRFIGWSLSSENGPVYPTDGTSPSIDDLYTDAAVVNGTVTMYAQWQHPAAGDLNADGQLGGEDISLMKNWLLGGTMNADTDINTADLNADGVLNAADLSLLKKQLIPAAVPQTASVSLTLNKSALMLNTDGAGKTYQLTCSGADAVTWSVSDSSVAAVSAGGLVTALKDGTATVTAAAGGTSVSCQVTVKTAYVTTYSEWSAWSAAPIAASDHTEVRTEIRSTQVLTGYHMDCYVTRKANSTQRQFRNYSAAGKYDELGLSAAYGEHHHSADFSVETVKAAAVIRPGEMQGGSQTGINAADVNGYSIAFGGANLTFFITSENYETQNVTYYSARELLRTPVVYEN